MTATYERTSFGERDVLAEQLKVVHKASAAKRCANTNPALDKKYRAVETAAKELLDEIAPGWDQTKPTFNHKE